MNCFVTRNAALLLHHCTGMCVCQQICNTLNTGPVLTARAYHVFTCAATKWWRNKFQCDAHSARFSEYYSSPYAISDGTKNTILPLIRTPFFVIVDYFRPRTGKCLQQMQTRKLIGWMPTKHPNRRRHWTEPMQSINCMFNTPTTNQQQLHLQSSHTYIRRMWALSSIFVQFVKTSCSYWHGIIGCVIGCKMHVSASTIVNITCKKTRGGRMGRRRETARKVIITIACGGKWV